MLPFTKKAIVLGKVPFTEYERGSMMKCLDDMMKFKASKGSGKVILVVEGVNSDGELADVLSISKMKETINDLCVIADETHTMFTYSSQGLSERLITFSIGSMDTALGSSGGYCAGPRLDIDLLRFNAGSYVFSASPPPYLTEIATLNVQRITPALRMELDMLRSIFRSELVKNKLLSVDEEFCKSNIISIPIQTNRVQDTSSTHSFIGKFKIPIIDGKMKIVISLKHSVDDYIKLAKLMSELLK